MISKLKMPAILVLFAVIFIMAGSAGQPQRMSIKEYTKMGTLQTGYGNPPGLIETILASNPAQFDGILNNREDLKVQIIYTQINRGTNGRAALQHHYFNINSDNYFYPASTVKLPVV
ncbi:MAG: hypothetical protein WBP16_13965, partial [Ferruginibacter sp.]